MKINKKTAAVISAAVINYITTEEKILSAQQAGLLGTQALARVGALPVANIWGISGRLDIMQMRSLIQFRTFNK